MERYNDDLNKSTIVDNAYNAFLKYKQECDDQAHSSVRMNETSYSKYSAVSKSSRRSDKRKKGKKLKR